MILSESRSKRLLSEYQVGIPAGATAASEAEAIERARDLGCSRFVVKAQISAGGRGLAGGVSFSDSPEAAGKAAAQILGRRLVTEQTGPAGEVVRRVYVEEAVNIRDSLYLGIVIDQQTALPTLLGSAEGGVAFEQEAAVRPEILDRLALAPDCAYDDDAITGFLERIGLDGEPLSNARQLVIGCIQAFRKNDISLLEVNPLAVTDAGQTLAVDAKIVLDGNALFRHPEFEALSDDLWVDTAERTARENEINLVRLKGNIGVITNGAGLGLATNDMIFDAGGLPANFMDIRTTATSFGIARGVDLLLAEPDITVLLLNVHGGGMTVCDTVVEGLAFAYSRSKRRLPIVARLAGQNAPWARTILKDRRLPHEHFDTMSAAVSRAVSIASGRYR